MSELGPNTLHHLRGGGGDGEAALVNLRLLPIPLCGFFFKGPVPVMGGQNLLSRNLIIQVLRLIFLNIRLSEVPSVLGLLGCLLLLL